MQIDRIIDAFNGDVLSKQELKNAYKKAFKLKLAIFIVTPLILFPIMSYLFSEFFNSFGSDPFVNLLSKYFFPTIFSIVPSGVLSLFIGNYSMHLFTRHLKITLPESIAPKIELRR